ncbi:MAG TPA: STAS domain-containing protein [Terriglobales bacterium]
MLRISIINESENRIRLNVEGWLVGPWVDELRQQSAQAMLQATEVTLDLEKLWFMDALGIALLQELAQQEVAYLNCSTFISQQLKETML